MKTIFEKSNGVVGIALTDKEEDLSFLDKKFVRNGNIGLPNVSELDAMRHYKELSDKNFCIEKGFYPLGLDKIKRDLKKQGIL